MQVSRQQAARTAAIGAWFIENLPRLWRLDVHFNEHGRLSMDDFRLWEHNRAPFNGYLANTLDELRAQFPGDVLTDSLADFFCFPLATGMIDCTSDRFEHYMAVRVAHHGIAAGPTEYAVQLLVKRIRYMLTNVLSGTECEVRNLDRLGYLWPTMRPCVELLKAVVGHPAVVAPVRALLAGEWNVPLTLPEAFGSFVYEIRCSYDLHSRDLDVARLWLRLADAGVLDYELILRSAAALRGAFSFIDPSSMEDNTSPAAAQLLELVNRFRWDMANDLSEDGIAQIERHPFNPRGARWLLLACRHMERAGLTRLSRRADDDRIQQTLLKFAGISSYAEEEADAAVAELKAFRRPILEAVLPHSREGEPLVLAALGWESLRPLTTLIRRIGDRRYDYLADLPNCGDPQCGVIDATDVRRAVEAAGEPVVRRYLAALRSANTRYVHTMTMIEAVMGWNDGAVRKSLAKSGQIAMKAYGLLPLSGSDEVLDRYLALRTIARECRGGPERVTNTRAAVDVGLTNLARTAGYPDRTRLEWAMEARLSTELAAAARPRRVGAWSIELDLNADPRVIVRKNGRELKTVPSALRKDPQVLELKAHAADLTAQRVRVRATLERMMVDGEALTGEQLRQLAQLPSARLSIATLVLRRDDGAYGIFNPNASRIDGLDGPPLALDRTFVVAHPWQLIHDGVLDAWQHAIVARHCMQTFKQVFREVYRPSPAEREADESQRFVGHALDSKKATRLFAARGWENDSGDLALPMKRFPSARLRAYFEFPDAGHFLAAVENVRSGAIRFERETPDPVWWKAQTEVCSIGDVPPAIFSEVMRDADLVVSVSARSGDGAWSPEVAESRRKAVRAVLEDYGARNVTLDGSFAYIAGTRSRYRVHLASGSVHLEPGQHVCLVPPGTIQFDDEHHVLPFPDDEEWKTADVISTILLFANDDRITNAELLAQISARG